MRRAANLVLQSRCKAILAPPQSTPKNTKTGRKSVGFLILTQAPKCTRSHCFPPQKHPKNGFVMRFAGKNSFLQVRSAHVLILSALSHHDLRVVHVSTHCSLREACGRVKKQRVLDVIHIADSACRSFGIPRPRIAVAGLNPHAGENGLFGREELDEIIPAIRAAQDEGLCVDGPVPPDSLFPKALGGWYDIVVAMYHDQGHIPLKTVGFVYDREKQAWKAVEGVNITLGLPIIRTSVDHGTGFDQAGKGTSNELSLLNAIQYAVTMARNRNIKE